MAEEKPKEQQAQGAPTQQPMPASEKKNKKINEMSLSEIDKKLEEVKAKMGNFTSKYALGLLKRKKELSGA